MVYSCSVLFSRYAQLKKKRRTNKMRNIEFKGTLRRYRANILREFAMPKEVKKQI